MKRKILLPLGVGIASMLVALPLLFLGVTRTPYVFLADLFTVPGVVLICAYLLSRVALTGFFDGFAYSIRRLFGIFIPRIATNTDYATYRSIKNEKRRGDTGLYLLFGGLVFFIPVILFTLLFYVAG